MIQTVCALFFGGCEATLSAATRPDRSPIIQTFQHSLQKLFRLERPARASDSIASFQTAVLLCMKTTFKIWPTGVDHFPYRKEQEEQERLWSGPLLGFSTAQVA